MIAKDYKLFEHFFEGDRRQYVIPVYQRNYDWQIENCKKLLDDIVLAIENDTTHFMGSIIQVQQDEIGAVKPFVVIDGQQRLTTIYLLLKAILDTTKNQDTKELVEEGLYNKFKGYSEFRSEKNKLKLKANSDDHKQLLLLMDGQIDKVSKLSGVYRNYDFFVGEIRKLKDRIDPKKLFYGIRQLTVVVVSLGKDDDPQAVFERINSTGVKLELDDLIRNHVLMTDERQDELYEKYWRTIEDNVPKEKRAKFFIDILDSLRPENITKKNAYDIFKKYVEGKDKEDVLKQVTRFGKFYSAFIGTANSYSKRINKLLDGFRRIDQSTLYTFLFHIFDDYENEIIDEDTLCKVLEIFLSYHIRRLICSVGSNTLKGLYKTFYKRVFPEGGAKYRDNYCDVIASVLIGQLKGTKDVIQQDNQVLENLKTFNIYQSNTKLCRFLLGTLENHNSREKIDVHTEDITLEHVLPQSKDNAAWQKSLGSQYEHVYLNYLHTLGNLTLTGYNRELSDKSFDEKKTLLHQMNTKIAFLNSDITGSSVWDENAILSRAGRLGEAINKIFAFPEWTGTNYHKVEGEIKISLGDLNAATNKRPLRYEFMGEVREIKYLYEALTGVIKKLYDENEDKMKELTAGGKLGLSFEKETERFLDVEDTDVYVNVNKSAEQILSLIKKFLIEFDISNDEFCLVCK